MVEKIKIHLEGNFFKSSYAVYIIELSHSSREKILRNYYYIGQTGDTKEITARAAIYRLGAHFSYGKSTQNQIYKAVCSHLKCTGLEKERELVENFLTQCETNIYYYPVSEFDYNEKYRKNKTEHYKKRLKTLIIESALIKYFQDKGDLLNKQSISTKKLLDDNLAIIFDEIVADFENEKKKV